MREILEFPLKRLDLYWEDLNTVTDNETENKAKAEIKELIPVIGMSMGILLICLVSGAVLDTTEKGGSAFMFFGGVVIFLVWALVTLRVRNQRKHRTPHNPKENTPQVYV